MPVKLLKRQQIRQVDSFSFSPSSSNGFRTFGIIRDKLPYTFYIWDHELIVPLESYLQKNKVSVEKVSSMVYQPQAIFRIRPVNRCSATIAEAVLFVAFTPDGKQLASGSGDTTVRLWDLNTQIPMFTCKGHKNWVLSIAWSPDGKHLVSGSKAGELQYWDPLTGQPSGNPLVGHKKWITGISWEPVHLSSPCRRFVGSSKDGDARIWDVTLRRCVICLSGHTLAVSCVKWGGDGVIYTGSQDCTVKVWETSQGKKGIEGNGHGHWVNSLALSTEYVLRTGAFDHTGKQYSSAEEMKQVALERYKKMKGNAPERLVSGSYDFTIFLREPSISKHPKTRMTGQQFFLHLRAGFSPSGKIDVLSSMSNLLKLGFIYWSFGATTLLGCSTEGTNFSFFLVHPKYQNRTFPARASETIPKLPRPTMAAFVKNFQLKLWKRPLRELGDRL
ncbi:hypothetical protein ACJRO7_029400 [Eucalyptus globulus]|uniref:Uncharacterized protein n=1 Tax=Eucalyptus globulus TaxID=34317 RepID=A0ABD3K7Q1_EUCGL